MARAIVFGGANMDIHCKAANEIRMQDSNIGRVHFAPGGVGRNIAQNIAQMGIDVALVTALGGDANGSQILSHAGEAGFAIEAIRANSTPCYVCILNQAGEMVVAVNAMADFERAMTPEALCAYLPMANEADAVVLDANLPRESLELLARGIEKPIVFDPVSTPKCSRARDVIGRFYAVKPNRMEAQELTGHDTSTRGGISAALDWFLRAGVRRAYITLGGEGVAYAGEGARGIVSPAPRALVNATGAGDAFAAALAYSIVLGLEIGESARFACAASLLALAHEAAVNPGLSPDAIVSILQKETWGYDDV